MTNSSTFTARRSMIQARADAHFAEKGETNADLDKVLNSPRAACFFTEKMNAQIDAWGVDTSGVFGIDAPVKGIMRFCQFAYAVSAESYTDCDTTTATIIYALHLSGSGELNRDALTYLAARIRDTGATNVNTKGVSRTKLAKLFGTKNVSTVCTQLSRSLGKNGFLVRTGAVSTTGSKNAATQLVPTHPMVRAFMHMFEKGTEAQIDTMVNKGKGAA